MLAPMAAVFLFLAAIVAAFGYLRLEEMEREQEAVRHDVEYTQQRLRLRLVERRRRVVDVEAAPGGRTAVGVDGHDRVGMYRVGHRGTLVHARAERAVVAA